MAHGSLFVGVWERSGETFSASYVHMKTL